MLFLIRRSKHVFFSPVFHDCNIISLVFSYVGFILCNVFIASQNVDFSLFEHRTSHLVVAIVYIIFCLCSLILLLSVFSFPTFFFCLLCHFFSFSYSLKTIIIQMWIYLAFFAGTFGSRYKNKHSMSLKRFLRFGNLFLPLPFDCSLLLFAGQQNHQLRTGDVQCTGM